MKDARVSGFRYKSLIKLTRPYNVLFGSLTAPVGAYIAYSGEWSVTIAQIVILQTLAVGFFIIFGNILNDIIDYEIDKINHPLRPLPSGEIKISTAKIVVLSSAIISLSLTLLGTYILVNSEGGNWLPVSVIWCVAFLLMLTYELGLKTKNIALIGNLSISLMVGLVIIFGAAALDSIDNNLIWYVGSVAFLVNLAREIVKDIEDIDGDKERKTLPMIISKRSSRIISWFLCLAAIILLAIPYYTKLLLLSSIIFQLPAMIVLLKLNIPLNIGDDTKSQKQMKIGMSLGLLGFLLSALYERLII